MMDDDISIIESEPDGDKEGSQEEFGSQYSELRIIGRDLVSFDVTRFGSFIKRIDLSFNFLKSLHGLHICCESLEELILDNNQLEQLELGAVFPRLETISLNKNRIWHICTLLKELKKYAVKLRILSLLGNPVCPDQLTSDYVEESEYPKYRCHILHSLRSLRFLDHRSVTPAELTESKKPSYENIKLTSTYTPLPSTTRLSRALSRNTPESRVQVLIPHTESPTGSVTPVFIKTPTRLPHSSKQGKRQIKYIGKNSEGNRFIKDTDL